MPLGIVLYIGPVVIEKFDLNVALARLVQKIVFVRPQIRVVALDVGITAGVTRTGSGQGEKIRPQRPFVRCPVGPRLMPGLPISSQAFVVGHGILGDEAFDALWMGEDHAKTNRSAVVLHIKAEVRRPERFCEVIDDLGDVVECVREFLRVGPITVAEAWIVGRDEMIAIRQPVEQRLEHARRKGRPCNSRRVGAFLGPASR